MERPPKTIVVDASTATKWFVEETDSDKASVLKRAHENGQLQLIAPVLLVYEVANALNYNPKMTANDLVQGMRRLLDLDLDLIPPRSEVTIETSRMARKYGITAYDASYIALADVVGTNCVTADEKLHRKMQGQKPLLLLATLGREWNIV